MTIKRNLLLSGLFLLASQAPTWGWESLDPATRGLVKPAVGLAARSQADAVLKYETTHFAVFYSKTGVHAIAGAGVDKNSNSVPDAVEDIGNELERIWRLAIDTLGYPVPVPAKRELGYGVDVPTGKYPIAVGDMATFVSTWGTSGVYGFCTEPGQDTTTPDGMEVVVENDFVNSSTGKAFQVKVSPLNSANKIDSVLYDYSLRPDLGWRVTLSHEFFHSLQKYYDKGFYYAFHEMSAVWFSTRAYPEIHAEWQYLQKFIGIVKMPAFSYWENEEYAEFPMVSALVNAFGDGIVKTLWENRTMMVVNGKLIDEMTWMHNVLLKQKLDEVAFNFEFANEVSCLYLNLKCSDRYYAGFKTSSSPVGTVRLDTVETGNSNGYTSGGTFQVDMYKGNTNVIRNGWNFKITYEASSSSAVAIVIRMPSQAMERIRPVGAPYVFNLNPGDTAIYAAISPGFDNSELTYLYLGSTKTPVSTGIHSRHALRPTAALRMDLQGRPVRDGVKGIVLEYTPERGWARRVNVGK